MVRYKFILFGGFALSNNVLKMKERIHKRLPEEFVKEVLGAFNSHKISEKEAMALLGIMRSRLHQLLIKFAIQKGIIKV